MGAFLTSLTTELPIASLYSMLNGTSKSVMKDSGQIANMAAIVIFLIGVLLMFKGISAAHSQQPYARFFILGIVAWFIGGFIYGRFKSMHDGFHSKSGDAANSVLNGNG